MELAIVAPALLLLVFFLVQAGLWLYGRNVALNAAREGVSELRLAPGDGDVADSRARAEERVERFARQVGQESLLDATATADFDGDTGRVTVTVTGRAVSLLPGLTLTVRRSAQGEIERFEEDR